MTAITRISMLTGETHTLDIPDVTEEQITAWKTSGQLIQDRFPHLTDDQREFLMTGSTQEEWNEAFPEDEDEEGEEETL